LNTQGYSVLESGKEQLDIYPKYLPLGDQVVIIQFEKIMSIEVNQKIQLLLNVINEAKIHGVKQLIPTFCSLAVRYNPLIISYGEVIRELDKLIKTMEKEKGAKARKEKMIHIPVVYGGEYGPDLEYVAQETGITPDEVVQIHHSNDYLIYMLGFIASFPYCGDLDQRIALKRRLNPRVRVEKGSIAIANQQTIIIPIASPSGWHIIGRTPMEMFNPHLDPPSIYLAGDYIKFEPISVEEAENWNEELQREWNEKWNL
jgi:inhibitor of KinA